jgi:hypothetical protein
MSRIASRAFSHYIRQVDDSQDYILYDLRNTYATFMYKRFGKDFSGKIGLHSMWDTTIEHYVNDDALLDEFLDKKIS